MQTQHEHVNELTTQDLDAVSAGALLWSYAAASYFSPTSRLDWVALNPQPLPPRWLLSF